MLTANDTSSAQLLVGATWPTQTVFMWLLGQSEGDTFANTAVAAGKFRNLNTGKQIVGNFLMLMVHKHHWSWGCGDPLVFLLQELQLFPHGG